MIDHKSICAMQSNGECDCQPKPCREPIPLCAKHGEHVPVCRCVLDAGHEGPHTSTRPRIVAPAGTEAKPPKAPSGNGGIGRSINQPSDFEYRTKALEFALQCVGDTIQVAARIEDYLRNGKK